MSLYFTNKTVTRDIKCSSKATAVFGGHTIDLCQTTRVCHYDSSYRYADRADINYLGHSKCNISESCEHESAEILYVNSTENVVLYRKRKAGVSFSKSSTDCIRHLGIQFNMWCKAVLMDSDVHRHKSEQIILVENGVETVLKSSEQIFTPSENIYALFILDVIDYTLSINEWEILKADPDMKKVGMWADPSVMYPSWCKGVVGNGDFMWDYMDVKYTEKPVGE